MPKERRTRPAYFDRRSRRPPPNPLSSPSRRHKHTSSSSRHPHVAAAKDLKEWDDIRCPVCMDHPHNAVLLLCSSAGKGCRPFMCDTSSRHSNCHDQYRKSFSPADPSCPLCRGRVTGSTVVESARRCLNAKARSCSKESCGFSGTYGELRRHARREHPFARPSVADPERQREWRMLEQQRELGDLVSTMQPAMGGDGEDGGLSILERLESEITEMIYMWGVPSPGGANNSAGGDYEDGSRQSLGMPQQQPWMDNNDLLDFEFVLYDDGHELFLSPSHLGGGELDQSR